MNERIRMVREAAGLSQTAFGARLGVSRDVVNNLERGRVDIKDHFVKLICAEFQVDENWLRTGEGGEGPIYNESEAFSLDRWAKEHGATELELEIVKVYFELDPGIRQAVMDHFKAHFATAVDPDEAEAEALKQDFLRQRKAEAASSATAGDDGARHTG